MPFWGEREGEESQNGGEEQWGQQSSSFFPSDDAEEDQSELEREFGMTQEFELHSEPLLLL